MKQPELQHLLALFNAGRYAELESHARQLTKRQPGSGIAWKVLGVSLCAQGKNAVEPLQRAVRLLPDDAETHNNLGNALHAAGAYEAAVASSRRALRLRPDFPEAHHNLGNALRELHQLDAAVASYHKAIEHRPRFADALCNLGIALRLQGQTDAAIACYRHVLQINPHLANAHHNLGSALLDIEQPEAAAASYRQALRLQPDLADAHASLAVALRQLGDTDAAEASCRRALELRPDSAEGLTVLARLRADRGFFAEAEALYRRAMARQPDLAEAWSGIAHLRRLTPADAAWATQVRTLADRPLPPRKEAYLRYAIAKYFDDVGDFEHAFPQYQRANELNRQCAPAYDRQQVERNVERIIARYDQAWLENARCATDAFERAVFIVGMPRSGTTLAEQIVASHPSGFGAGELNFWHRASARYQAAADNDGRANVLPELADDYRRLLLQRSPVADRVVDKMPMNFQHLGLIHAALPNARIIHLQRHPIDTCLSIYFQQFSFDQSYANDLADLAHYYWQYQRLMQHWRELLPAETLLEVPYEQLVADQERWTRRIVDFIGLPWDSCCLDFHATERAVLTPSSWQVRQAIHCSSVQRWRHYEHFLGPLRSLASAWGES